MPDASATTFELPQLAAGVVVQTGAVGCEVPPAVTALTVKHRWVLGAWPPQSKLVDPAGCGLESAEPLLTTYSAVPPDRSAQVRWVLNERVATAVSPVGVGGAAAAAGCGVAARTGTATTTVSNAPIHTDRTLVAMAGGYERAAHSMHTTSFWRSLRSRGPSFWRSLRSRGPRAFQAPPSLVAALLSPGGAGPRPALAMSWQC